MNKIWLVKFTKFFRKIYAENQYFQNFWINRQKFKTFLLKDQYKHQNNWHFDKKVKVFWLSALPACIWAPVVADTQRRFHDIQWLRVRQHREYATVIAARALRLGVLINSAPRIRRIVELLQTLGCPRSKRWKEVAKMAITIEQIVRFGPNFARINIFQFHGHLKGKV